MNAQAPVAWQTLTRRRVFRHVASRDLSPAQGFIVLRLMEYADYETGENAYPGLSRLGDDCGVTERTLSRALQQAKTLGLIRETQHGGGSGDSARASVYRFLTSEKKRARGEAGPTTASASDSTEDATAHSTAATTEDSAAVLSPVPAGPPHPPVPIHTDSGEASIDTRKKKNSELLEEPEELRVRTDEVRKKAQRLQTKFQANDGDSSEMDDDP
ncbi:helix-turn-helix domain-containing protein [Microbacterium sp. P07]|uniref:helix-turn-helix domain-containing protein n=1 Tax=Microbacterium sp. P07 TaxID=3366952 RepID=UPI00374506F5